MSEYKSVGSKRSYPGKSRPTKGSNGEVMRKKVDRDAPGTGLGYDDDIMRQVQGDYKKAALRPAMEPSPMRVITTLYG